VEQFVGVSQSASNSQGIFYPGGGWTEHDFTAKAIYNFCFTKTYLAMAPLKAEPFF
jgi:hypothetical protein